MTDRETRKRFDGVSREEVELARIADRPVRMTFCDGDGRRHSEVIRPVEVRMIGGADYLVFHRDSGTGTLRLDQIDGFDIL